MSTMEQPDLKSNPFHPELMRIVRRYRLTDDVKFFQVRPLNMERALSLKYLPGQFMMVSVMGEGEAPFSISSTPSRPGLLEFCIREVGNVTEALFQLKENSLIGVRGPYGNGFPIEKMIGHDLIIVVGGLGAAPLRSLLLYALDNREMFGKLYFLHGAKKPSEMLFREEFIALRERDDLDCLLTVDNDDTGTWPCYTGLVTTLFQKVKNIDAEIKRSDNGCQECAIRCCCNSSFDRVITKGVTTGDVSKPIQDYIRPRRETSSVDSNWRLHRSDWWEKRDSWRYWKSLRILHACICEGETDRGQS